MNAVEVEQTFAEEESQPLASAQPVSSLTTESEPTESIVVAQAGQIDTYEFNHLDISHP